MVKVPVAIDIGNRRAGNQPRGNRADNRRLGRAAAQVPKGAKCLMDEMAAGACPLQQCAKQDKQEDEFADTPRAIPNTPSVVIHIWLTAFSAPDGP